MRVILEQLHLQPWAHWCKIAAMGFCFGVFVIGLWLAWRMPKQQQDRMSNLPLEDDEKISTEKTSHGNE